MPAAFDASCALPLQSFRMIGLCFLDTVAAFNLQGGGSSELYVRICIITSLTLVGMSWQKLDIPCSQLPHTYIGRARKPNSPQQAELKRYQPWRKHTGKAVPLLCPAHCCCWNHVKHQSSQLSFHLAINHLVWEVNGNFADRLQAYFGEGKGTVCNECKNHLTTCRFICLAKQFWTQVACS